jgi:hypothetical protein
MMTMPDCVLFREGPNRWRFVRRQVIVIKMPTGGDRSVEGAEGQTQPSMGLLRLGDQREVF